MGVLDFCHFDLVGFCYEYTGVSSIKKADGFPTCSIAKVDSIPLPPLQSIPLDASWHLKNTAYS